ncbi:MAG: L-threonylcarbamoyladenylate synthase [Gemmatimonadota bacterium]|nr:L-threonylcarbamoyladenylate synthase [Gemmatimonadota bacterium]
MNVLPFCTESDVADALGPVRTHLDRAGLLAYPTETVYGLGSLPRDEELRDLAKLKGRDAGKPFLLLVAGREMAERHGLVFNAAASRLADHFWPGPLTMVLPGGEQHLPDALRGPELGIAVRWTSHAGMAWLIGQLGIPITSTSANRPGGATAPGAGGIVDLFGSAVESGVLLVLDGGVLGNVPPSTVIDCTHDEARLVREGAIPLRELRQAVGRLAP